MEGSLSQPCNTAQPFSQAPTSGTMKGGCRAHTRALCCVREDELSCPGNVDRLGHV